MQNGVGITYVQGLIKRFANIANQEVKLFQRILERRGQAATAEPVQYFHRVDKGMFLRM